MTFLYGDNLADAICRLVRKQRLWFAVAFWGKGSERLIRRVRHKNMRLICNLSMGGTNPSVIEESNANQWRQHSTLHAKVYIGDRQAIVTSANASANGLGFEARTAAGWVETGVLIDDPNTLKAICDWFERTWRDSGEITKTDIENAKRMWKLRKDARSDLSSFANFNANDYGQPLLSWEPFRGEQWTTDLETSRKVVPGDDKEVQRQIEDAVEIEGEDDRKVLTPGRWILFWTANTDMTRREKSKMRWVYTGKRVEKAGEYKRDKVCRDVVLSAKLTRPVPFDPNEKEFVRAFDKVMSYDTYSDLRSNSYSGAWFTKSRQDLMVKFWVDVKKAFDRTAD